MKKTILAYITALAIVMNFSCVLAFEKEDVTIKTSMNKIDVSVASDKNLGRMTLQVLDENGNKVIYFGQENSYTEKVVDAEGNTEYKYVFDSFHFPSAAITGNYNFRLSGNDRKIVVKPYNFVNVYDSYNFLNGLDKATDVFSFLNSNKSTSLIELDKYFNLPDNERSLMNTLLAGLDLSVKEDFSNLQTKEALLKEQFNLAMLVAQIMAADTSDKWVAAISDTSVALNLETAYYSKLNDKKAAYKYFTKPAVLDKNAVSVQFDKAVMLCTINDYDYGSTETVLNHYVNKGVITLDKSVYNTLSETKRLTVCQLIKEKNITDATTLEREFKDISLAVSTEPETPDGGGAGGGGGGGAGGGGGGGSAPSAGRDEITVGNGLMGNDTGDNSGTATQNKVFKDIDEVSWAKGYILSLESKGILSGKGDGKFYPKDNMLREEFVKVISLACKLDTSLTDVSFTDTASGSWYMPYITAGVNAGIINGLGDGRFGVGQSITREDAAVMIARAIEYVGVERSSTAESFADSYDISPYAQDAVAKLRGLGIISGDDTGCFLPKNTITRAEISKMICGMLDVIGG